MTTRTILTMVGLIAGLGGAAGAVQLAALGGVTPGEWQLKEIGGTEIRMLCVTDPGQLLQIRPAPANCTREVVDGDARAVTVRFSCAGGGNGRTTLTVRSPQSLKLETQGMAGGAPFAVDYDARRIGDCPGATSPAPADDRARTKPGSR